MDRIRCDKCNKEFSLDAEDIKTKIIDNIEVQYFECKHCDEKYIIICTDDYIIKEQQRYKCITDDIQALVRAIKNNKQTNTTKYYKKLNELVDKQIRYLDNIKLHSSSLKLKVIDRVKEVM